MRILGLMVVTLFLVSTSAFAATINLTNGSSIQGDVVKKDAKSIEINVDGVTMTYYSDEIKDIDGQSFDQVSASTAPAPATPAATDQDQAAAPAPAVTPTPAPAPTADQATAPTSDQAATPTPDQAAAPAPAPADQAAAAAPSDQATPTDQAATPAPTTDQAAAPAPTGDLGATAPAEDQGATPAMDQTATPATTPEANAAVSSIDPDKRALILKFIDVFGTRRALTSNFDTMIAQIAKDKPEEAEKIRERVKVDEIIERLLPIYDRNFSSDDLKSFIDFYGSEEGQKLISTIPELMKESVQESIKYMQEKFPETRQGTQQQ